MVEKKDSFNEFLSVWEHSIKKIEDTPMDSSELNYLINTYHTNAQFFITFEKFEDKSLDRYWNRQKQYLITSNKLIIAASISLSKWKDKHPGIHELFFSKLKNINIGINLPDIK